MKILRISHVFYREAVNDKIKNWDLINKSTDDMLENIFKLKIHYSNSISVELNKFGYEIFESIYDVELLQKKWAYENDIQYDKSNWEEEIIIAQIKKIKPDILFFQHFPPFSIQTWKSLREICPSIKIIMMHMAWIGESPVIPDVDILLVGTKSLVDRYKKEKLNPYLMYHYFDESVHNCCEKESTENYYPVTFLGSSGYGYGPLHASRYWLLDALLKNDLLEAWLWEKKEVDTNQKQKNSIGRYFFEGILGAFPQRLLKSISKNLMVPTKIRNLSNAQIEKLEYINQGLEIPPNPLSKKYPTKCHDPLFGIDFYKVIGSTKISLQKHGHTKQVEIGAMRLFQVTGMGSLMMTDYGLGLEDLFVPGDEVVVFDNHEDAIRKIKYYLSHETERQKIAKAGQAKTLQKHTARNRAEMINDLIIERMRFK
jgi:hypothetical protein